MAYIGRCDWLRKLPNFAIVSFFQEHTDNKILTNDDILGDAIPIDQQDAMRHLCYQMLDLTATVWNL